MTPTPKQTWDEANVHSWATPEKIERRRKRLMKQWEECRTPGTQSYARILTRFEGTTRQKHSMGMGRYRDRVAYLKVFVREMRQNGGEFTLWRACEWIEKRNRQMSAKPREMAGILRMNREELGIYVKVPKKTFHRDQPTIWGCL